MSELQICTPMEGGYYAGRAKINGREYGIAVAPKAHGEHKAAVWNRSTKSVEGALSYCDGLLNTQAMADAGSKIAAWALALDIGGHKDWYIASQDELEVCYRAFKPTDEKNWLSARSGINLSAVPPTYPYTAALPAQTADELFRAGGSEAFEAEWYWTSTQHASGGTDAWCQDFSYGNQYVYLKGGTSRARAVRRFPL